MFSLHSETSLLIQATIAHLEEYKNKPILASYEDYSDFKQWALEHFNSEQKEALPPLINNSKKEHPCKTENFSTCDSALPPSEPLKKTTSLGEIVPESKSVVQVQEKQLLAEQPSQNNLKNQDLDQKKTPFAETQGLKENPRVELKPAPTKNDSPAGFAPLPALEESFLDLRKIWIKMNGSAPLFDSIPDDEIAKKIASRWKVKNAVSEVSILSYHEPPAQKALLQEIARAINILLRPTQIVLAEPIEKEKQWETFLSAPHLKYTIACDYTLWQLGGLMQHYRETPSQATRHLGSIPLFLLPDLSLYLKDPLLKRSLWKALCQILSS